MNMDHPIGKNKTMETKVRFQVDTKVEIMHYSLYWKRRGSSYLTGMS